MRNVECSGRSSVSGSNKVFIFGAPALVLSLLVGCNGTGLPVGDVGDGSAGSGGKPSGSGGATGSGGSNDGSGGRVGGSGGTVGGTGGRSGSGGSGGNSGKTCGGIAGIPCPSDQYCHFKDGECLTIADVGGQCAAKPQACAEIFAPVCGCDGKTYPSSCAAAAAGVSVAKTGACASNSDGGPPTRDAASETGKTCGGIAGASCSAGDFCLFPVGQCQIADNQGQCAPKQMACLAVAGQEVCGCDGKTYNDQCASAAAGVSLNHLGVCAMR